jgi:TolB-like protein
MPLADATVKWHPVSQNFYRSTTQIAANAGHFQTSYLLLLSQDTEVTTAAANGIDLLDDGIRQQLERVLSSSGFRKCVQLSRFLRFTVDQALAEPTHAPKETCIGVEIFGRRPDYDPSCDPVVRVEARRLRVKLAHYYANEGREDPVRIDLPKGGYLPAFEVLRPAQPDAPAAMAVLPFASNTTLESLADGLTARLIATLASMKRWRMVSSTSVFQFKNRPQDARRIGEELNASLILEGNLRQAGKRFRCDAQLVSSKDGLHVWAGSFDSDQKHRFEVEDEFANVIATGVSSHSL